MSIKKILVSVALISMVWVATTAYIGSNTEKHLNSYISKSNKIYENSGMKISLTSFNKGFLSSQAKLSVDIIDPKIKKELEKFLKFPIVINYEIENGPILAKNGLAIGASRIHSIMNINELLTKNKELKEFIKKDIIVDTTMLINFNNEVEYESKSNQIIANIDNDIYTIAPLEAKGKMNMQTFIGNLNLVSKSIKGDLANKGEVKLENITLNADITKFFDNGFYLGDFDFNVDKFNVANPNFPQEIKNAKVKMFMKLDQNSSDTVDMNLGMKLNIGDTKLSNQYNFAKELNFNYGINGGKLTAWLSFQKKMKDIQQQQTNIIQKLSLVKTREEQMKVFEELREAQLEIQNKMALLFANFLVKDQTEFTLQADVIDTLNNKSNASCNIKYIGDKELPKTAKELKAKFQQELLNWITLNIDINLQKSLVNKLPQEIKNQLSMAIMTGMLKDNNSSYEFNANYVPTKLMVNGQDKSSMLLLLKQVLPK